jgi:acyl carrier protein
VIAAATIRQQESEEMDKQPDDTARLKLAEIFSAFFRRPIGPEETVNRNDEERWDSLRHVELVFVIEDAFGVTFPPEVAEKLTSMDAFADAVRATAGEAE